MFENERFHSQSLERVGDVIKSILIRNVREYLQRAPWKGVKRGKDDKQKVNNEIIAVIVQRKTKELCTLKTGFIENSYRIVSNLDYLHDQRDQNIC